MDLSQQKFRLAVIVLLLAILGSIFFLAFLNQNQSVDQVAYVDLEKVFNQHPARTAAEQKLNQKAAAYQQKIEQEAKSLPGVEQKKLLYSYQSELENLEAELLDSVLKEVENIIIETAENKKVKFVLEADDVLYGGVDLTDAVLAKINSDW
ncbi:OmpH family outer membrane protein [Halanaerobium praevalens]|uniref:Outer membrane chaperone Skp (OmpH) n=1 Tax=Halanaerobium praevalens (strain ATCC 33744 / DSM 2228 / GSL) TaxID=572479 RepID=E3DRE2_HALPG|nr:OmpH family outer membrane protein [Halanaerobium praevalens]ADO78074.1 outer membrane chaperone Skp (OmpH) [Halanaerobium praevalens DSM 2228]